MYLTRRQTLSSLAVTMIGVPALARDVALTASHAAARAADMRGAS
jgi:hypothetical protein